MGRSVSAAARGDLLAQVLRGENADRPETAGGRYGSGELVPGETTAHPRLDDRHIQPESVQDNAHASSIAGSRMAGQAMA